MSVPADELEMLQRMAFGSQPTSGAMQPQGMINTDPGNISSYMQNKQLIDQLGSSSADLEKRQALDKQMMMAKYLGGGPNMPHGTHIPGYMGGVYVAPNALQDAGAAAQYIVGGLSGAKASTAEMDMALKEAHNRTAIMQMYNEQMMRPPQYGADLSALQNQQNPLENYNFGPQGGPPRNTNLQPGQAPPRQMSPEELEQIAAQSGAAGG